MIRVSLFLLLISLLSACGPDKDRSPTCKPIWSDDRNPRLVRFDCPA